MTNQERLHATSSHPSLLSASCSLTSVSPEVGVAKDAGDGICFDGLEEPLNYIWLLIGLLLIPTQQGLGACNACFGITNAIATYETIEQEIEEWVCIGYEAITNEDGETVQEAIMELQTLVISQEHLTGYIEETMSEHTCNLPAEELPEYIPPTPPVEPEVDPYADFSAVA